MTFEWLSTTACQSCTVIPKATHYDELGYPLCPNCGTLIRTPDDGGVVHAETD